MTEPLTPLERRVYHYLIDFLAENTYQPSIREIAKKFRIKSTKTVSDLLASLSTKGFIERDHSRSRGVRIVGHASQANTQPVPYYGRIHAGEPALLPEHRAGFLTMDRRFLPTDDVFVLRVKGEAMIGRGIFDGDYVLVSPSKMPRPIIDSPFTRRKKTSSVGRKRRSIVRKPARCSGSSAGSPA
jgi:repressor LexA